MDTPMASYSQYFGDTRRCTGKIKQVRDCNQWKKGHNRMQIAQLQSQVIDSDTRILMIVLDGLGGLPTAAGRPTELEQAMTPNLDELAARSICGLHQPVTVGITPGSGPSHLALFGYDPLQYRVGRGVPAALGIDFPLQEKDVAARINFCTVDGEGRVTDRRAGRMATKMTAELCRMLAQSIELEAGVTCFLKPVKDYRALLVLRGEGLDADVSDSAPQANGRRPLTVHALKSDSERTASLVNQFVVQAEKLLRGRKPANMLLLRGFSRLPEWPSMQEAYGLRAAAITAYPMYRGLARLVGMEPLQAGATPEAQLECLARQWKKYDFFYVHCKTTDSTGEDDDFNRKVRFIEAVDARILDFISLNPDVLIVTGNHSTPAVLGSHSWHPVPVLLYSRWCRADSVERFGERHVLSGGLGPRFAATDLMPLALANARRLRKFDV